MGRPIPDLDRVLEDRARTISEIEPVVSRLFVPRTAVQSVAITRLERRLLRLTVGLSDGREWVAVGKVYGRDAEGEHGFDVMRRLQQAGFGAQAPIDVQVPEAYAYLPALRLLLMQHAPGEALKRLVKRKRAGEGEMRRFAAALAKLHSRRHEDGQAFGAPFTVERHLASRCAGLHDALTVAFPSQADRVHWIIDTAKTLESRHRTAPTLSHGDFHFGQVHIHDGRAWILDLDPLHIGDPSYDVAMVFVMLKLLERRIRDDRYVRMLRDAFIRSYFCENLFDRATRVPMHMALIHLKRACKRFRWQDEAGWPETVCRQLTDATVCLQAALRLRPPRSVDEIAGIYDRCPVTA
jgi:aminoglycoside phosphotransferase (APT) family kinase protein